MRNKIALLLITLLVISQSNYAQDIQFPNSYIFQENEIPSGFKIKTIDQETIDKGFQGNPGFLTDNLIKRAFYKTQLPFFSKVYVAVYTNDEQEEIVITVFKLNKANTIFNEAWQRGIALIKEDVLVMLSTNISSNFNLSNIANTLAIRTGASLITKLEYLKIKEDKKEETVYENTKTVQFIGSINKKVYGIIALELNSDKYKNGVFLNLNTGENIPLAGTYKDGVLRLKEYQNNQEMTGYFEGELQENYIIGSWLSPNRKTEVGFAFKVVDNLYKDINYFTSKLPKQIQKIETAINNKDWETFISYCDREQYITQTREVGFTNEEYIFGNLEISSKEELVDLKMDNIPYEKRVEIILNKMEKFKIDKVELDPIYFNFLKYSGTFIFKGRTLKFHFYLNNDYKITGAVG